MISAIQQSEEFTRMTGYLCGQILVLGVIVGVIVWAVRLFRKKR